MTFRGLAARWFWSVICLGGLTAAYVGISLNEDLLAEWSAPSYIPLTEEEIFRRSNVPCVRPTGAKSGCTYPEVERPAPTGDLWIDQQNAKIASLEQYQSELAIKSPEYANREEYVEREIRPRRNRLNLWSGLLLGLAAISVVLYAFISAWTWWRAIPSLDFSNVVRIFSRHDFASGILSVARNRKLRRVESQFQTLKSLHENGLISNEVFENRKNELRVSIKSGRPSGGG